MAGAHGGKVQIPYYATGLRGEDLQAGLASIAPTALKYGATDYSVTRNREDRYKFLLTADFPNADDFYRWWEGTEYQNFRIEYQGYYQLGVLYSWNDLITSGHASYQPV